MNSKAIATTVVFTAVTVALNPIFTGLAIPAPFFPMVLYYIWEIPIAAIAFLISPKHGILVALVNMAVMLAIGQGLVIQQPFYQSVAAICSLIGMHFALKITQHRSIQQDATSKRNLPALSTALGILVRVGIMAFLAYALFRLPIIGFSLPDRAILAIIPLIALYDATLPLYTIPIGYLIARTINKNLASTNLTN